jgi:hypothetical protein
MTCRLVWGGLGRTQGSGASSEVVRQQLEGSGGVMPRTAEALQAMDDDMEASVELGLVCGGGSETPPESFCDLLHLSLPTLQPPTAADFPESAPPWLRPVWEQACAVLDDGVLRGGSMGAAAAPGPGGGGGGGTLLARLYHRFGFECGCVGKVLHDHKVVWGTYRDKSGYHCNAHANNLVLRRPCAADEADGGADDRRPLRALLMPCDFDMAYTSDTCHFGRSEELDQQMCAEFLEQEFQELGRSLAMSADSTGVRSAYPVPQALRPLRLGLRDTLVRGWLDGAAGRADRMPLLVSDAEAVYALLKLAIIMTHDVIA